MILGKNGSKPEVELSESEQINNNFQKLASKVKDLENRLQGLETLSVDLHGKDAVDLHQSINTKKNERNK